MAVAMRSKFWPHKATLMRYCDSGVLPVATGLGDQLDLRKETPNITPQTHRQTDPHHLISAKNILYVAWFASKTKQKC